MRCLIRNKFESLGTEEHLIEGKKRGKKMIPRLPIEVVLLLSMLAGHLHYRVKLGPIPHEPPPIVCDAHLNCH